MTFNELVEFVEHKMAMSHVYQPALIRALISAGGSATLRQLAQAFLSEDESLASEPALFVSLGLSLRHRNPVQAEDLVEAASIHP